MDQNYLEQNDLPVTGDKNNGGSSKKLKFYCAYDKD